MLNKGRIFELQIIHRVPEKTKPPNFGGNFVKS